MENLSGKQLGPYRVMEPLGEGGMATVYQAYQAGVDRVVALKILPQYFSKSAEFVQRFKQESYIVGRLQHPHILPIFDYGEAENYTYIAMPFIKGDTLAGLLKNSSPMPLSYIEKYITQVGSALDYAHVQGILHRDIKPSNILVDEQDNCLLMDFGIAQIAEGSNKLTKTGNIVGTPAYMSPEQGQGLPLDRRSDIYALGVILYEMATGQPPFKAETPVALIVKHIHSPLPIPRTVNPQLPQAVELVILKALDKIPNNRYTTAGAMIEALQTAIQSKHIANVQPTQTSNPAPVQKPLIGKLQISLWKFILSGILLLSMGGVGSLLLWGQLQNNPLVLLPSPTVAINTITPLPFSKPVVVSTAPGDACVGTKFGISCLTKDGKWQTFTEQNSELSNNYVSVTTACTDNSFLFLTGLSNIDRFNGEVWQKYTKHYDDSNKIVAFTCTEKGDIWVGQRKEISVLDKKWQIYPFKEIMMGKSEQMGLMTDMAISSNGLVWVTLYRKLLMFDGIKWVDQTPTEEIIGSPEFTHIAIGPTGDIWIINDNDLLRFDGLTWTTTPLLGTLITDMAIDQLNQVWIATLDKGLFRFSEGQWGQYHINNSNLKTNQVTVIQVDTQNRVWVGTPIGLQIWAGGEWYHYNMGISDIVDNDIRTIAVIDAGPSSLPLTITKSFGGLTGRVLLEQQPIEATLELCLEEELKGSYNSKVSYCLRNQKFYYRTTTNTEGYFTFSNIPVGRYILTIHSKPTGWIYQGKFSNDKILVSMGNEMNLGDFELTELIN